MATPADQRLLELLDKWLISLDLHVKYSSLDDDSYSQIQPWPEHQRPSRWIIDLAKQKAIALRNQIEERVKMSDAKFSDSLELMTFLANLVGAEHIERFIPLAHPDTERPVELAPPDGQAQSPADSATGTREMPQFIISKPRAPAPVGTQQVARTERKVADTKTDTKALAKPVAKPPMKPAEPAAKAAPAKPAAAGPDGAPKPPERTSTATQRMPSAERAQATARVPAIDRSSTSNRAPLSEAAREQVIADAVRLVQWGRKWYELSELISSMADRPSLTEVRRILKDNKTVIDKKAGRG